MPRKLTSLDGEPWDVTEDDAFAEAQSITGILPTNFAWSKKTLAIPLPQETIVAHFKQAIFQANTGRGQLNYDFSLALANSELADVVLILKKKVFS